MKKLVGYKNDETVNKIVELLITLDDEDIAKLLDYFDYVLETVINERMRSDK